MKFKVLFALSFMLFIGFTACDKTEYIEKSDIETENGFVKGTLKGSMKNEIEIDESFNLIYSSPGDNRVIDNYYYDDDYDVLYYYVSNHSSYINSN